MTPDWLVIAVAATAGLTVFAVGMVWREWRRTGSRG